MRQHKFRGKREDNGEWVYGSLLQSGEQTWIIDPYERDISSLDMATMPDGEPLDCHEVEPATVGEFTGLKDKDGKDGYETDIAQDKWGNRWLLKWDDEAACFRLLLSGADMHNADDDELNCASAIQDMVIIGTIHDAPEAVKSEPEKRKD